MDPWIVVVVALIALALGALLALALKRGGGQLAASLEQLAHSQAAAQQQMAETLRAQERAVAQALEQRLESFGQRVGERLKTSAEESQGALKALGERLAVIDQARETVGRLAGEVTSLQALLANKQARGAFGEAQLEAVVRDMLPAAYVEFQATLKGGTRADCLLKLPPPLGPLCIDAKFPREAYDLLRQAGGDAALRTQALRAFGQAVLKHVEDIAAKYVVPGETAEAALMFVPSEAVYAEIHDQLGDAVERARRRRVYIVSPTTLWAVLNTLRAVIKDTRLKEQAHLIQAEVRKLLEDMARLDERVTALGKHFAQATDDVRKIQITTDKLTKTGQRIDELELDDEQGKLEGN
jgi:DNA recombination protein RmuC